MAESEARLNLCGAHLLVRASNREDLGAFVDMFRAFATGERMERTDLVFTMRNTGVVDAASDLPLTWAGILPEGLKARIHEDESLTKVIVEDRVAVRFDHQQGRVEAHFPPGDRDVMLNGVAYLVVAAAVERSGQALMHAATLVHRDSGRAILLCVPSGGGKTTTALALCHDGYDLVTDDASVLCAPKPGTAAGIWGLPRPLKVHRNTADLLGWLGPLQNNWDDQDEQAVRPEEIADRIGHVAVPKPVDLAAIIVLGPRSGAGHLLAPMPRAEALVAIAGDNVAWRPAGMTQRAARRFDMLSQMVAATPTFSLNAGKDLAALPEIVSSQLAHCFANERGG